MRKNRRGKRRKNKRFHLEIVLGIVPFVLIIAGASYYLWTLIKDDLKYFFYKDDVTRFLNNDKQIEQQDESYNPDEEEIELHEENTEKEEVIESNLEVNTIPYPDIIPEEDFERTSSELYEIGAYIPDVNWEELNATNEQANAWLYIPDSNQDPNEAIINLPVVQGVDNEYYLYHNMDGEKWKYGTLFIDWRDNPLDREMQELSDVTTIYGHHMKSDTKVPMFDLLCNYKEQDFFDEHPYGIVVAENGEVYKIDFFAGVIVDGNDENNVYTKDFIDESQFNAFFDNIISNSTITSDCDIQYGDKIVALATCSYEYKNARYVLYGRLTRQLMNDQEVQSTLINRKR